MDAPTVPPAIGPDTPMAEVLAAVPSARRALFRRYHVGGCSSCAFQPTDTLAEVCRDHNILDVDEVLQHLLRSEAEERRLRVEPSELARWLSETPPPRVFDLRIESERAAHPISAAEVFDYAEARSILALQKSTHIVFVCADGERALDSAAFFAGHGFERVYALSGGAAAWRS